MIFGNESIAHFTRSNMTVWMIMAFQAGLLNTGGYMACHRFVSHVTGFSTFLGYDLSQANYSHAWGMFLVPIFFLFGAMLSGQLVDVRLKLKKKPKYYITFGIIFALILTVFLGGISGLFGKFGEPFDLTRDWLLLAILCLTCGIQNGTVTTVSKSVVRTTHLTGLTTDLGIGIVRLLNRDKITTPTHDDIMANIMRAGIIFFFCLGGIIGAVAFLKYEYGGFLIPTLISGSLFGLMMYFQIYKADSKNLKIHSSK